MGTGKQKNIFVPLIIAWEKYCRGDKDKVVNMLQIFQYVKFLTVILRSQCKFLIKEF